MQQLKLLNENPKLIHGGSLIQKSRIGKRPLAHNRPIHLILKANKEHNLRNHYDLIIEKLNRYASNNHIQILGYSVQRDHIHVSIKLHNGSNYSAFVRSLTGVLSRKIGKGLWKQRPYTRIGSWGRDFKNLQKYIEQNEKEVRGLQPYKKRSNY